MHYNGSSVCGIAYKNVISGTRNGIQNVFTVKTETRYQLSEWPENAFSQAFLGYPVIKLVLAEISQRVRFVQGPATLYNLVQPA